MIPGTGTYIGERLAFFQRIQMTTLNLAKMRQITQLCADMLGMVEAELQTRT